MDRNTFLLLASLYPEHYVVEILIRIEIIAVVAETVFYFFSDHPRAMMIVLWATLVG